MAVGIIGGPIGSPIGGLLGGTIAEQTVTANMTWGVTAVRAPTAIRTINMTWAVSLVRDISATKSLNMTWAASRVADVTTTKLTAAAMTWAGAVVKTPTAVREAALTFAGVFGSKTVSLVRTASITWASAVLGATRFITDTDLIQKPIDVVLAGQQWMRDKFRTWEINSPNYKFERAVGRSGTRRLKGTLPPSFTVKTDKRGYD